MAETQIHATRACSKCGVEKMLTADNFHIKRGGNTGKMYFLNRCRPCQTVEQRSRNQVNYKANREQILAQNKAWREANPDYEASRPKRKEYHSEYTKRRWADMTAAEREDKRALLAQWRAANPDKVREIELRRREKDRSNPNFKAKAATKSRVWRQENPDKAAEARRKAKERDPTATARYCRAYAERNPEKMQAKGRAWREKNPAKVIAYSEARRERVKNAVGEISEQVVLELMTSSKMICFYCEQQLIRFHVDHFIPVSRGGTNLPENLRLACGACNRRKSNKMPWEWKPDRFSPPA